MSSTGRAEACGIETKCCGSVGCWSMRHSAFCSPGPTGYSTKFADIGKRFSPIDLAAIPIEAYEARWLMSSSHVNPEEAVDIHLDVRVRYSVGIHRGTFQLTDEPMDEPPVRLKQALITIDIPQGRFLSCNTAKPAPYFLLRTEPCSIGEEDKLFYFLSHHCK